jgi:hypothetical protein
MNPLSSSNFKYKYNERRHDNNLGPATHLLHASYPKVNASLIQGLNPGSIVEGDKGRRHQIEGHREYSDVGEWKCSMRINKDRKEYGAEVVERGRKFIAAKITTESTRPEGKKLNMEQASRRGYPMPGLSVNFKSLKHYPEKYTQAPAEYDMETYMNKKQRSGASIEIMRNGIPNRVPGDRAFKKVEHEPGYYAKGGLIPGSSIQLKKAHTAEFKKSESNSGTTNTGSQRRRQTFAEKRAAADAAYDLMQVTSLTNSTELVPCFEERTGAYLVKPEDEAY